MIERNLFGSGKMLVANYTPRAHYKPGVGNNELVFCVICGQTLVQRLRGEQPNLFPWVHRPSYCGCVQKRPDQYLSLLDLYEWENLEKVDIRLIISQFLIITEQTESWRLISTNKQSKR